MGTGRSLDVHSPSLTRPHDVPKKKDVTLGPLGDEKCFILRSLGRLFATSPSTKGTFLCSLGFTLSYWNPTRFCSGGGGTTCRRANICLPVNNNRTFKHLRKCVPRKRPLIFYRFILCLTLAILWRSELKRLNWHNGFLFIIVFFTDHITIYNPE